MCYCHKVLLCKANIINLALHGYGATGMTIKAEINAIAGDLVGLRHDLHENPQIGFQETFAHAAITARLKEWSIPYDVMAETGIVATIEGRRNDSGKSIGLRVDMDALKMPGGEKSGVEWSSHIPDKMHACGHDGHMTIGLTTARYLSMTRNFNGTVKIIFQPAEERMGGAKRMIAEGLFEKHKMTSVHALHNWPDLPRGTIAVHPGAVMASSDYFDIHIIGRSGHAGQPDKAIDAGRIMRQIGTALDNMADSICAANASAARNFRSAVISTTSQHAGEPEVYTRLPGVAHMIGTVRCFDPDIRLHIEEEMNHIAQDIAAKTGAQISVQYNQGSKATINNGVEAEISARVARKILGDQNVLTDLPPESTAEDFGWMLAEVPGSFIWLGQRETENPDSPHNKGLHNEGYDYNDLVTPIGASYFAELVEYKLAM